MKLDINEELLREAVELSGGKTVDEVVNLALTNYVRVRKQGSIVDLFGTIDFDPDFDYKAQRRAR